MYKDNASTIAVANAIAAQTVTNTTPVVGSIIDTKGIGALTYVIFVASSGTINSIAPTIDDGDDSSLSDAAAVGTDFLIGSLTALTATSQVVKVGVVSKKRYNRLTLTGTGTNSVVCGALVIKGELSLNPAA